MVDSACKACMKGCNSGIRFSEWINLGGILSHFVPNVMYTCTAPLKFVYLLQRASVRHNLYSTKYFIRHENGQQIEFSLNPICEELVMKGHVGRQTTQLVRDTVAGLASFSSQASSAPDESPLFQMADGEAVDQDDEEPSLKRQHVADFMNAQEDM